MFKKKFFLLLIIFTFSPNSFAETKNNNDLYKSIIKNNKIIVGISFDSRPFGFQDSDGEVKGMEADLAKEIAKRLLGNENKVVFKNITSQDRIKAVKFGDVDIVISTMTINRQRKKIVNFSIPYFMAGQVICVKKDNKINSIYDLINKKVIVILGTTGEKNIKRFIPNALVQGYPDNSEAIEAFKNGYGDAITTDDSLLQNFIIKNKDYMILPKKLSKEFYGIAFQKSRQTNFLRHKINDIIKKMKLDGTLQAIKDKWIVY
jgi:putative glutamine transport system substrate-binding protein